MSWTRFFRRRYWDEERARELEAYLEIETDENIARGMSREEARFAAKRKLGNLTLVREEIYRMNSLGWLESLWQDSRFALRVLRKNLGFTAMVVITLGLGIGANAAIFSVVNSVLLRPLPYKNPGQLVHIYETDLGSGFSRTPVSYPNFLDWRAQNHVFESMAAYNWATFTLTGPNESSHVQGLEVSAEFFSVLGVRPALGRGFLPEEDQPGHHAVVLSHELWTERFNSGPSVLGQSIQLDRMSFTVVGVMPAGFQFPIQAKPVEVWVARGINAGVPGRADNYFEVVARLRPEATLEKARAEMATVAARLAKQYPDSDRGVGVGTVPEHEQLVSEVRPATLILFGAVVFVLLIASANVANLLLARAASRGREIAIRAALGAGKRRIVRQLLTESFLLAAMGGALGVLLAGAATGLLVRLGPKDVPRLSQAGLDGHVLAFSLAVTLFTGLIFGLAPALRTAKADLIQSLKAGGATGRDTSHGYRLRAALIVSEVALTLLLLAGAGLMVNSLIRLTRVNLGFNPKGVLTFAVDLSDADYTPAQGAMRFSELLERIKQVPGVRSAAADSSLPLSRLETIYLGFQIEGQTASDWKQADTSIVTPGFFRTLDIPLLKGRDFTVHDGPTAPRVVIVSQSLARQYFPRQDAVRKHIRTGLQGGDDTQIIGVVGDVRQDSLTDRPPAALYMPEGQVHLGGMRFVVRFTGPLPTCVDAMRRAVRSIDKGLPLYDIRTLDEYQGLAIAPPRFNTLILGTFAVLAVVLSAVGLYGVVSYVVGQQTHELGVRMALGATQSDVVTGVLRQGLTLALVGIGVGLVSAFALTRLLANQLYGIKPADPLTFIAVSAAFTGITVVASYIPARRATKVDPTVALRYE
jgi:putative ABC transport system permease protein